MRPSLRNEGVGASNSLTPLLLFGYYRHFPKGLHGRNSTISYTPLQYLIETVNWVNLMANNCKRSSMKPMLIAKQQVSASEGEYKNESLP